VAQARQPEAAQDDAEDGEAAATLPHPVGLEVAVEILVMAQLILAEEGGERGEHRLGAESTEGRVVGRAARFHHATGRRLEAQAGFERTVTEPAAELGVEML